VITGILKQLITSFTGIECNCIAVFQGAPHVLHLI